MITFDELYIAERTCMYQMTAQMAAAQMGREMYVQPQHLRANYNGPWGERIDARLHLDAWRRVLDKEEPDYAS